MKRPKAVSRLGMLLLAFGLGASVSAVSTGPAAPDAIQRSDSRPVPLILRPGEGERRIRRVYGGAKAVIKIDRRNGGAPEFVMGSEELPPGQAIAAHRHPGADEIVFVHSGKGLAELGDRKAEVEAGATIYIPRSTRMTLRNTGSEPLAVSFIFSRPGYEEYLRATSVPEGDTIVPLSAADLAAIRARHREHIVFDQPK
jgi:quercetin dioxygenase-like cupin family protein